MKNILIIREGRILLDEAAEHEKRLCLKICVGTNIHKYDNLTWNESCNRWETNQEIKLPWTSTLPIELQLYYPSRSIAKVVGQATIEAQVISSHLEEELKIVFSDPNQALTYDGLIKGWLYCLVGEEGRLIKRSNQKYLYIHKINLFFLEDCDNQFTLTIFQNETPIYEKNFIPAFNSKNLYPNIRNEIRYSDVIRLILENSSLQLNPISILVDKVKRGKTSNFETWIRNKYNNKAGDLRVEYFLENIFLENERKVLSRKPVFPHTLSRMSTLITENIQSEITKSSVPYNEEKTSVLDSIEQTQKEDIEEMSEKENENKDGKDRSTCEGTRQGQKRSRKLITGVFQSVTPKSNKINEKAIPCMKKAKTLIKVVRKQKHDFYLNYPLN